MEILVDSLDFTQPLRGDGPRQASKTVLFPREVISAVAGLGGYLVEYGSADDHHVGRIDLRLTTQSVANSVTVTGTLGLRDWSGTWDDQYAGMLDFVVMAELESATATPPRGDLIVTGIEFNQASQFFRAAGYLDGGTVRPDNSIFMIEGRNTGVRVYVDWDSDAGLAPIALLTGQLTLTSSAGTTTLLPINPGGAIVPRRDVAINLASANDTLNFMIPSGLATGLVSVSCRVFDQANPAARSSAFTRSILFTRVEPLNVFLVGVTTTSPVGTAPSQAAIIGAFTTLIQMYPRSLIQFTGYNTITLTAAIAGLMPSSGCGAGWSTLLDQLRDLRGGSGDIYFGGLPPGISAGGVVGCSPTGDRLAAGFIDLVTTIPHEVGHSVGLRHDPCRGCSPAAQNPDPNYPQYGTFASDSIGAFGFDPTTNTVLDPASALDFMTAFLPPIPWISPYRHQGLLGPTVGGPSPGSGMTLAGGMHPTLFLGLEVDRQRNVRRETSFHYPAVLQGTSRCRSEFTYEFLDAKGEVLDCGALHCMCSDDVCSCWPKTLRDALPYPDGAAKLNVLEEDRIIYDEAIPPPPDVRVTARKPTEEGIPIVWRSKEGVAYLVHYLDERGGAWRGAAPRHEANSFVVPWRLFGDRGALRVRVLASSGIATGTAEIELKRDDRRPPDVSVSLPGEPPGGGDSAPLPGVTSVVVTDANGAKVDDRHVYWFDGEGRSLGRGSQVDLRSLPEGLGTIRAVVRGHGGRTVGKSWTVNRSDGELDVRAVVCDPERLTTDPDHKHPHPIPEPCKE